MESTKHQASRQAGASGGEHRHRAGAQSLRQPSGKSRPGCQDGTWVLPRTTCGRRGLRAAVTGWADKETLAPRATQQQEDELIITGGMQACQAFSWDFLSLTHKSLGPDSGVSYTGPLLGTPGLEGRLTGTIVSIWTEADATGAERLESDWGQRLHPAPVI